MLLLLSFVVVIIYKQIRTRLLQCRPELQMVHRPRSCQARFGCLTICFHLRGSSSCLSNGVKVHRGPHNVVEGGAIVLTLKDQSILVGGDINEDTDMLENIEIGEQKRRDETCKAAKKKIGIYDDK